MHEANLSVKFNFYSCATCGVIFCIPADLDDERREDGENIYCCNGHTQSYSKGKDDQDDEGEGWKKGQSTEADIKQRRQKILELHNAEQAEAKAAELAEKAKGSDGKPATVPPAPPAATVEQWKINAQMPKRPRLQCSKCSKTYKGTHCLKHHLVRAHALKREEADATAEAIRQATIKELEKQIKEQLKRSDQ